MLYPQCRILEAEIAFWLMPVAYTRILFSVSVVFSRLPASILGDFRQYCRTGAQRDKTKA